MLSVAKVRCGLERIELGREGLVMYWEALGDFNGDVLVGS
jgi:hypothetical protein